jgi:1-deoxy-D-xylulose 5-phosphate reductoisomerase
LKEKENSVVRSETVTFLYKVPLSVHTIYDVDYENPDYEKFPALKYAKDMKFLWNMVMRFYSGSILAFQQIFEPGFHFH